MRCRDRLAEGGANERVEGRVRGEIGESGRRLASVWVDVFRDRYVLAAPAMLGGDGVAKICGGCGVGNRERGAWIGKDRDRAGAGIVGTRGVIRVVLSARVYVLDDVLGVGAVVRSYGSRSTGGGRCENGGRKCNCVQVGPLSYGSILENDQQAGIVLPLDLESAINSFPFCKC
jgi:hypothetical protein